MLAYLLVFILGGITGAVALVAYATWRSGVGD